MGAFVAPALLEEHDLDQGIDVRIADQRLGRVDGGIEQLDESQHRGPEVAFVGEGIADGVLPVLVRPGLLQLRVHRFDAGQDGQRNRRVGGGQAFELAQPLEQELAGLHRFGVGHDLRTTRRRRT